MIILWTTFFYWAEAYLSSLVKWMATDDQPFTAVKTVSFQNMAQTLNSEAKTFSATTI